METLNLKSSLTRSVNCATEAVKTLTEASQITKTLPLHSFKTVAVYVPSIIYIEEN